MKNDFIFILVWEFENCLCFKGFERKNYFIYNFLVLGEIDFVFFVVIGL